MQTRPFLKWAGGKRWLAERPDFSLPDFPGRYIEPFLGGGAMFFATKPTNAILSDSNSRLISTYIAIRDNWQAVVRILGKHHKNHSKDYYYAQRSLAHGSPIALAARFIYLNRACWNGLYRVNRRGEFNVPIGTKDWVLSADDDFRAVSDLLQNAIIKSCDFEDTVSQAREGDLVFADPPYTVAHNFNGFVKYNENIFSWDDQVRLAAALNSAVMRGAIVIATNADHPSVHALYEFAETSSLARSSVISGSTLGRQRTTELIIRAGHR